MREIKFRGKRTDNGKWVYGDYGRLSVRLKDGTEKICQYIGANLAFREVNPETVGQYTERKDNNEAEVYAEDIVKVQHGDYTFIIGRVSFEEGQWMVIESDGEKWDLYSVFFESIEVVGNMFDNPELLEGK